MHKIHLNLEKIIWKNLHSYYFFVSPFGLQLIWAISVENGNPSTQPAELSDERGRVELIESTLFVSIAENKTNSLEKMITL